jgi:hypothetical protein
LVFARGIMDSERVEPLFDLVQQQRHEATRSERR